MSIRLLGIVAWGFICGMLMTGFMRTEFIGVLLREPRLKSVICL